MCGVYGMVSLAGYPLRDPGHADHMRLSLAHRGPDGHGCVSHPHATIGVNRLRIIDRHSRADQPFASPDQTVWVAVNGEIYNAADLRRQYADYPFRSGSDVEPVLPLYLARGAEGLADLDGMFAVAIWDERSRTLVLARDRAGEKPLFVAEHDGEVWFASEPQALFNGTRPSLDPSAAADIMRLGFPLEPRTIWKGIRRVEAGTIATFGPEGRRTVRYWEPNGEWGTGNGERGRLSPHEAGEQLADLLLHSVQKQLVADVPVGVFTSGGLDSALLVALARQNGVEGLHTFAVRFPDASYDESRFARAVATQFGTRHTEAVATDDALHRELGTVIASVAEPITDPAILPTLLLARTAREHVGVVLSGEGADELFGGYPTYLGHRLAPWFNRLPSAVRRWLTSVISGFPSSYGKVSVEFMLKRFVAGAELPWFERHVAWFGTGLPAEVIDGWTGGRVDGWTEGALQYSSTRLPVHPPAAAMLWDYSSYLRDLLLPKIDRATSLVALESRAPYLDADLTRFAHALPARFKVRGLTTKWLLRRVARRWLPASIVRRRKRGLSVPVAAWLNGPLSTVVDRVLAPDRLARQGLLNPRAVSQLVAEHRRGHLGLSRGLWALFAFELWLEHWMPEATG